MRHQASLHHYHSFLTDPLHQPHKDLRRARGASQSIVPTTTGAAKALTKIFSYIRRENRWLHYSCPVADGSLTDITFNVNRAVTIDEINEAFRYAAQHNLKGIRLH
jgi:glyceraldehyde 3-phosphate dehydrogenase